MATILYWLVSAHPTQSFLTEAVPIAAFSSAQFAAFVVASFVLAVIPGPAVVYILTRTLSQGRRAGLASVGGIAFGNLGNAAAACIGLATLFAVSRSAFVIVKVAGAAYLIFLGLKALRASTSAGTEPLVQLRSPVRLFRDGFWVALLNPKTALFFAALLPQFLNPHAPALGQSLVLSCLFVSIALCTDTIYVLTASALASQVRGTPWWRPYGRYLSAATFIGLGIYAAFSGPRERIPR